MTTIQEQWDDFKDNPPEKADDIAEQAWDMCDTMADRIDKLEAALREIATGPDHNVDAQIARAALEGEA